MGNYIYGSREEEAGNLLELPNGTIEDPVGHREWLTWDKPNISDAKTKEKLSTPGKQAAMALVVRSICVFNLIAIRDSITLFQSPKHENCMYTDYPLAI